MRGTRSEKSKSSNQDTSNSKIKIKDDQQQKIRNELTDEQKREIRDAFSSFEQDGLLPDELKTAMKTLGFDANNQEVLKILDKIDAKKGPLKFDDFMDVMVEKNTDKDPDVEIRKAFKVLCEEGTDKITLKSLSKICTDLGEKIGEEELQEMINEADKDQDDEVGEEDFIKIMQKTGMF